MSDTTGELVRRLRVTAIDGERYGRPELAQLANEAADRLEQLDHATSDVQQLSAQLLVEQERRAIAESRVAELERALGPFALQSARMLGLIEDGAEKLPPSKFTTADLQRAVDALSPTTDD